jgi:hypothetical protein
MLIRECLRISFVGVQEYLEEILPGLIFGVKSLRDDVMSYLVHHSTLTWPLGGQPFQEGKIGV